MTPVQIERLRVLCDAADQGALRGEELRELTALARKLSNEAAFWAPVVEVVLKAKSNDFASHEDAQDFYAGAFGY